MTGSPFSTGSPSAPSSADRAASVSGNGSAGGMSASSTSSGGERCGPQLDLLTQAAAERVGDRGAQVPFDLVLHETARHRQQSKPLDDGQRADQIEPRSLLWGEGDQSRAVGGSAVGDRLAVELETTAFHTVVKLEPGSSANDASPWFSNVPGRSTTHAWRQNNCPHSYTQVWTG